MLVVRFGGHLGEALGACWRLEGYFGRSVGALGLLGETVGAPLGASGSSSEASGVPGETLDGPWASFRAPQWGLRKLLTSFMLAFGCLGLSGGGHCGEQVNIVVRIVVSSGEHCDQQRGEHCLEHCDEQRGQHCDEHCCGRCGESRYQSTPSRAYPAKPPKPGTVPHRHQLFGDKMAEIIFFRTCSFEPI